MAFDFMKSKYCEICGASLPESPIERYNDKTGEKLDLRMPCKIQDCKHGCHSYTKVKTGLFEHHYRCTKCGYCDYFI